MNNFFGSGTVEAEGGVVIDANFGGGSSTLLIDGLATRTITLPVGAGLPPLVLNASNVTLNVSGIGAFVFNNPVTVQNGTAALGAGAIVFNNTYSQSGGTFSVGSGAVSFNSSYSQSGGTFNGGSGTATFNHVFDLQGGIFTAPSGTMNVVSNGHDFSVGSGATFNANGGTVEFTGSAYT